METQEMRKRFIYQKVLGAAAVLGLALSLSQALAQRYLNGIVWPEPTVVTPGEGSGPPSDAIVLFDGKNFDAWSDAKGKDVKDWKVDPDGGFTVKGLLKSKQGFGDFQLHLEFA